MTLIAKILIVASAVCADGKAERKEFKPGEEVTGLSDHDERELLKMKALIDTDREEASDQYDAMRAEHAQREFERERQAVLQKRGSTEAQARPAASSDTSGPASSQLDGAGSTDAAGNGEGNQEGRSTGEPAAPAPNASAADATAAPPAPAADAPAPAAPVAAKPARGQKSN